VSTDPIFKLNIPVTNKK